MWWYISALSVAFVLVLSLRALSHHRSQAMMESLTQLAASHQEQRREQERQRGQRMDEAQKRLEAALSELGAVLEAQVARTERLAERQYVVGSGRWSTRDPRTQSIPPLPRWFDWTADDFRRARHPDAIETTATERPNEGDHRRDGDHRGGLGDGVEPVRPCELRAGTDESAAEEQHGALDGVGDHHTG